MARRPWVAVGVVAMVASTTGWFACSGGTEAVAPEPALAPVVPAAPPGPPAGPLPSLIMVQSQFLGGGPGPAKMTLFRTDGTGWFPEVIEDPDSNVWHKAIPWRDGILTIGANGTKEPPVEAHLKHWKKMDGAWVGTTLWAAHFGGKFNRLRDLEVADVDGDGAEEIVVATHDQGVVAVGDETDGVWSFVELDGTPDTFVHEVEIGDVDGDGALEFYVTPSGRNKSSGVSQPGGVVRYAYEGGKYVRSQVVDWSDTHAKEILVADVDADGTDELYVAREGVVRKEGKKKMIVEPVQIVRMVPGSGGTWTETVVAKLEGEKQLRFLMMADVDHDGAQDLVAAAETTGLFVLKRKSDGTFTPELVDKNSGGFEHATHVADLDGDGKVEIYSASEKPGFRELRRYLWEDGAWKRQKVSGIPKRSITWNLQDGTF